MLTITPFLFFGTLGMPELLIILVILLLLFGATKLPQLGGALGKTLKSFKKEMKEGQEEEKPLTCPNCQTEITDKSAEFCPKCGQRLK